MKFTGTRHLSRHTPRGFTLTELLVVILIIAALAALSITGIQRMRSSADKVAATRSLSQLQIANTTYSTDNGGRFVPYVIYDEDGSRQGWWYQVPEFLIYFRGEVYDAKGNPSKTVPTSMLDPKVVRARLPFYNSMAGSFGLNITGLDTTAGANKRPAFTMSNVTRPAESMAFASATDVRIAYPARFNWKGKEGKTSDGGLAYRHNDKVLVAYFDGHVSELTKNDMKEIDSSKGGSKSSFWLPTAN